MAEAATLRFDRPLSGIAFVVAGVTVFSVQDVIIKWLSGDYPVLEIVFVRSLVSLPLLFALAGLRGGQRLRSAKPFQQGLRGFLMFLSYTTYYLALAALPLAETVSIFYSAPLFMTALSGFLLGEHAGVRRWSAIAVGFIGVLVIMKPQGELSLAALLALGSAVTYAFSAILARRIGETDSAESMAISATLVYVVIAGSAGLALGDGVLGATGRAEVDFLLRAWTWPSMGDFLLFCVCGVIAAIGFTCLAQAYRLAPATAVAPFEYASLPWAVLWGWAIWSELPTTTLLVGIVLVVGSGLYVFRREAIRAREGAR
jgi:drug/metabolite transporter (DMT)-like permease